MAQRQEIPNGGQPWLREGLTRVPYRVFQTEGLQVGTKSHLPGTELALSCA